MHEHQRTFLQFAFANGLRVFENAADDRTLKSKRISPWFFNVGDFNDGVTLAALSEAYAGAIIASGVPIDILYGIPEKGVGLAGPVAIELARRERNVGWSFKRKMPKEHGEGTGKTDATKLILGRVPQKGERIGQLDDVFTAGDAKYAARAELEAFGQFKYPLLVIAVDRQEVGIDGKSAIVEYERKTGTSVVSVVRATDVLEYLKEQLSDDPQESVVQKRIERLSNYLRVYGTEEARNDVGKLEQTIIAQDRSVIPACDVETLEQFGELVKQTAGVEGIGGYKIGFEVGYDKGLKAAVDLARTHTDKPIILDHQKAGSDIPDTGKNFARAARRAGIDAVIIFPQAGPETARAWIYHALDHGLKVIVGGRMTHPAYAVSEGGWITDEGAMEMYAIAARAGVRHFVVPGNKPDVIKQVRERVGQEGVTHPVFYGPGLGVGQGGDTAAAREAAGTRFNAIVGRGIYGARDIKAAACDQVAQLRS